MSSYEGYPKFITFAQSLSEQTRQSKEKLTSCFLYRSLDRFVKSENQDQIHQQARTLSIHDKEPPSVFRRPKTQSGAPTIAGTQVGINGIAQSGVDAESQDECAGFEWMRTIIS
ncbi:hypothetical protein N7G274_002807 [Stereocaulon virgatum]|uniref:Uncharacterized protein n=1 Tax=Stereocaulon virgatum TaxID=373712 RepID=A0ABR4AK41_9LECA